MHTRIDVSLGERSYPILIGEGLLAAAGEHLTAKKIFIVTDSQVGPRYLPALQTALADRSVTTFTVPAGEASKSFAQMESLLTRMLAAKPDRRTCIVALGGGVVGDLAGFAASILLRGVPFVQIPTTLLAMVDSSVGGKTGINTDHGKNLIGSFYQPQAVLMDTATLATLPEREKRAGMAEVVKYGCIEASGIRHQASGFFEILERGERDISLLVQRSCEIKAAIVGEDEREETGRRALLNFGHSFGHALEAECGYDGTLLHGEAVAIGMVMAADLSARLGLCDASVPERIRGLLKSLGLLVSPLEIAYSPLAGESQSLKGDAVGGKVNATLPPTGSLRSPTPPQGGSGRKLNPQALLTRMQQDKKVTDGKIQLILLKSLGEAVVSAQASQEDLRSLWKDYTTA